MNKLAKLRDALKKHDCDALLVTSPINRRYMTNFTGSAGIAIISQTDARFITDFRYVDQATEQAAEYKIVEHQQKIELEIKEQLKEMKVERLGFETDHITHSQFETFKQLFDVTLVPLSGLIEEIRLIKTEDEIKILKEAAKIADDAFQHILSYIKPGTKEIDIANELEFFMRRKGASSSSFDTIVASGVRSALPHGVASEKEIQAGELVTLDYGALYKGYCSDITRTVAVGEISKELEEIYDIVLEANQLGIQGIRPGMSGKEADSLTRDYIKSKGYGDYFGHSTGHGIGLEVHEGPRLSKQATEILKPGMVVTVEPGIYISDKGGCRIEDDILITDSGNERITFATKELIYV